MLHSWPCTTSAVSTSTGMCRPRCATVVMSLPFLITAVRNALPNRERTHVTSTGPTPRDLAGLAGLGPPAPEHLVVQDEVHPDIGALLRFRFAHDEVHERVSRVRLPRLMILTRPPGPEEPLRFVVERGEERPADLGCQPEPPGNHPVVIGPGPELAQLPLPVRPIAGVLDLRPRVDALTAAAPAIIFVWRDDKFPSRSAASISGRCRTFDEASSISRTSPTRSPSSRATNAAALRSPRILCAPDSSICTLTALINPSITLRIAASSRNAATACPAVNCEASKSRENASTGVRTHENICSQDYQTSATTNQESALFY